MTATEGVSTMRHAGIRAPAANLCTLCQRVQLQSPSAQDLFVSAPKWSVSSRQPLFARDLQEEAFALFHAQLWCVLCG